MPKVPKKEKVKPEKRPTVKLEKVEGRDPATEALEQDNLRKRESKRSNRVSRRLQKAEKK